MTNEHEIDCEATVREVVIDLLLTTLPSELRVSAPDLADRVLERPDVARHARKRWGELSEGEGNIVAREVGLVARDIRIGAVRTSTSGEHLH